MPHRSTAWGCGGAGGADARASVGCRAKLVAAESLSESANEASTREGFSTGCPHLIHRVGVSVTSVLQYRLVVHVGLTYGRLVCRVPYVPLDSTDIRRRYVGDLAMFSILCSVAGGLTCVALALQVVSHVLAVAK